MKGGYNLSTILRTDVPTVCSTVIHDLWSAVLSHSIPTLHTLN